MGQYEQMTMQRDLAERNRKDDDELKGRLEKRKKLELEAKQFQDKQIAEKAERKRLESLQKQNDSANIIKQAEEYNKLQEEKRKERIMKNKNHLNEVIQQMQEEPKMFAKTGVAIIKNS